MRRRGFDVVRSAASLIDMSHCIGVENAGRRPDNVSMLVMTLKRIKGLSRVHPLRKEP